jgi:hypothetical protein
MPSQTFSLPLGNAALHLGPLPEGDPRDITNAEPQCQPAAQLGLRHGEGTLQGGSTCHTRPAVWQDLDCLLGILANTNPPPNLNLFLQVLCCVDKQGILSWPNPSPETVLFFSGKVEPPHSSHEDLTDDLSTRSFCHPEVEEEVWPAPVGPTGPGCLASESGQWPREGNSLRGKKEPRHLWQLLLRS